MVGLRMKTFVPVRFTKRMKVIILTWLISMTSYVSSVEPSCKCINGLNGRDGRDGKPGRDGVSSTGVAVSLILLK